jgi:hypothetical protein
MTSNTFKILEIYITLFSTPMKLVAIEPNVARISAAAAPALIPLEFRHFIWRTNFFRYPVLVQILHYTFFSWICFPNMKIIPFLPFVTIYYKLSENN